MRISNWSADVCSSDLGSREIVCSDDQWRTRPGPIVFSSIFGGEDHDARLEIADWDRAGAAADGWAPVLVVDGPDGTLKPQGIPPMTLGTTYPTVAIPEPRPRVFVYDFGKNCSSRPATTGPCPARSTTNLNKSEALCISEMIHQPSNGQHTHQQP